MSDPTQTTSIQAAPWYRQFWPWLLISIPLATVIAGIMTIWVASREPLSLVHDDYYKEGLAVNQNLARDRQAAHLQLRAALQFNMAERLVHGQLFSDNTVSEIAVRFIHPVASQYDQDFLVPIDATGHFELPMPTTGNRWYLELRSDNEPQWRLQGEVNLKQSLAIELSSQQNLQGDQALPPSAPAVSG